MVYGKFGEFFSRKQAGTTKKTLCSFLLCGLLSAIVSCTDDIEQSAAVTPTLKQPAKQQERSPLRSSTATTNNHNLSTVQLYDGMDLEQWRERIKSLDPSNPDSGGAVKGLLAIVKDVRAPSFSRRQAALTLGRIGEPASEAIEELVELLEQTEINGQEPPRTWSLKALSLFGPIAKPATPILVRILQDRDEPFEDRLICLEVLGRIGAEHANVIPVLTSTLQFRASTDSGLTEQQEGQMRAAAAIALGWIGPPASAAVPALIRATGDQSETIRRNAVMSLGRMREAADIAIPTLAELIILDASESVRDHAADALASIGPLSIPVLQQLLVDEDTGVRWRVARALGSIGPRAKGAFATLQKAFDDDQPQVRISAIDAVRRIGMATEFVVPYLIRDLTDSDRQIRMQAFRVLTSLGPPARVGIAQLTALLDDERSYVRNIARMALEKLE